MLWPRLIPRTCSAFRELRNVATRIASRRRPYGNFATDLVFFPRRTAFGRPIAHADELRLRRQAPPDIYDASATDACSCSCLLSARVLAGVPSLHRLSLVPGSRLLAQKCGAGSPCQNRGVPRKALPIGRRGRVGACRHRRRGMWIACGAERTDMPCRCSASRQITKSSRFG